MLPTNDEKSEKLEKYLDFGKEIKLRRVGRKPLSPLL